MNDYIKKDQLAWQTWKDSPTSTNLNNLIKQVQPLISHHVTKMNSGNIPRSALEAKATRIAIESFPKYDPNKTQLNTFLTWQLKQLNRYVYKHQNIGKIPESRIVNIGTISRAKEHLRNLHGQEPTLEQVADYTKIPLSEVRLLERENRRDISADFGKQDMFKQTTEDIDAIYTIWADSNARDREVLDYLYGLHGKPQLSIPEISSKLNMSTVRLSQIKNRLGKQVLKYKLEMMPKY